MAEADCRLGVGNEVPTVASHATLCLLVMIKVLFGTFFFLHGYGFLEHPRRCQTPLQPWDQSLHTQVNESRHATGLCPFKYGRSHLWKSQPPLPIISDWVSLADACQLIMQPEFLDFGGKRKWNTIKPTKDWLWARVWSSCSEDEVWNSRDVMKGP